MTWSVWDIVVLLTFFLQLVALGAVGYVVLKIKKGTVTPVTGRAKSLVSGGKGLVLAGKSLAAQQMPHIQGTMGHIVALRRAIHLETLSGEASGPISYAKILSALATLRTARRGWAQVQTFRGRKTAPPGPASAKKGVSRLSIAERLGLIPPAAKHLGKAYGVVRLLLNVRRELRQRNIL